LKTITYLFSRWQIIDGVNTSTRNDACVVAT